MAATIPSPTEIVAYTTMTALASSAVAGKNAARSSRTYRWVWMERPKFSETRSRMYDPYWTGSGRSKPMSVLSVWTASALASGPAAARAGSAGMRRVRTNVTIVMPTITITDQSTRSMKNRHDIVGLASRWPAGQRTRRRRPSAQVDVVEAKHPAVVEWMVEIVHEPVPDRLDDRRRERGKNGGLVVDDHSLRAPPQLDALLLVEGTLRLVQEPVHLRVLVPGVVIGLPGVLAAEHLAEVRSGVRGEGRHHQVGAEDRRGLELRHLSVLDGQGRRIHDIHLDADILQGGLQEEAELPALFLLLKHLGIDVESRGIPGLLEHPLGGGDVAREFGALWIVRGEAGRQEPVGHLFGPVEDLPHRGVVEGEGDGLPDALVPKRRVWLLDVHRVDECAIRRALHQLDAGPPGQVVRRLIGPDRVEVHHVDLAARQHELLRPDVGNDPDQDAVQVPLGPSAPVRRVALEHDELIFLRLHRLERPRAVDVRGEPGPPVIRIAGVRLPVDEDL